MEDIIIDYDLLQKIDCINQKVDFSKKPFPKGSVCENVDSLSIFDDEYEKPTYGVSVSIEPIGVMTRYGESFEEAINWWEQVFISQPEDVSRDAAGWKLFHLSSGGQIDEDADKVWSDPPQVRHSAVLSMDNFE